MKRFIIVITVLRAFFAWAQGTFSFNVNGTVPQGFVQGLDIAGQKWSAYLNITVPVKVNVFAINTNLVPFSGLTLANGRQNFSNAPYNNILYTTALANQLANSETNPGEYDMDIYFNLFTNFYFGTGKPASSQLDFISTAMHEIGHGLGFYSDGYVDGNGVGSFGDIPPSAISPLSTSFPWHGQDSVPSIFDKYITKASGNHLTTMTPQYSIPLGDSIKNGALYFSGPVFANLSNSGQPVRLSGGAGSFGLGTDLLHIHQTVPNTIMSYYWGAGDTVRIPAKWEIGILREIGWKPNTVGVDEFSGNNVGAEVFPNPAQNDITIWCRNMKGIEIYSIQGEQILARAVDLMTDHMKIDLSELPKGLYFLRINNGDENNSLVKKLVVN